MAGCTAITILTLIASLRHKNTQPGFPYELCVSYGRIEGKVATPLPVQAKVPKTRISARVRRYAEHAFDIYALVLKSRCCLQCVFKIHRGEFCKHLALRWVIKAAAALAMEPLYAYRGSVVKGALAERQRQHRSHVARRIHHCQHHALQTRPTTPRATND